MLVCFRSLLFVTLHFGQITNRLKLIKHVVLEARCYVDRVPHLLFVLLARRTSKSEPDGAGYGHLTGKMLQTRTFFRT